MKKSSSPAVQRFFQVLVTLAVCAAGILIGQLLHETGAPAETIVCIYMLVVVICASVSTGYAYGILSALICTFAYNFFISVPHYSLAQISPYFILTASVIFIVSILISSITSKVKEGEVLARKREEETNVLYHLVRDLSGEMSIDAAIEITLTNIASVFQTDCRMLQFDENEVPLRTFVLLEDSRLNKEAVTNVDRDFAEYKSRPAKGYYVNETQYEWPMYSQNGKVIAAVAIPVETIHRMTSLDIQMVSTMVETAAIAFDKIILARIQQHDQHLVSQERYRTNLLRSISHDLRTPLAGISGTAEVLMEELEPGTSPYEMAHNIRKETIWLYNLVQNVLSLTKLQNSNFAIKAQVNILEEVVDSAVETMEIRLPERKLNKIYTDELIACKLDPSLLKQVVINLIDNANKYSPVDMPIEIVIRRSKGNPAMAEILIRDFGDGLSQAELDKIFEMFYTTKAKNKKAIRGYGLGLPICDSIMKAHGGSIQARNREDGKHGAVFILELPVADLSGTVAQA